MILLPPPDIHHLRAAQGWLEMGNPHEADKELEKIKPHLRVHADFLAVRWELYASAGNWESCLHIAVSLTTLQPRNHVFWCKRATTLHRLGRMGEARDTLLLAVNEAGEDSCVFYELARYECLLLRVEEARAWLGKAFDLVKDSRARKPLMMRALEDPDLGLLWNDAAK